MARLNAKPEQFKRADILRVRRRVVLSSHRGQVYMRAWPRKRGRPFSELQQAWVDDFGEKARTLKSVNPYLLENAQQLAKDTGWYYRDVLERAARGKLLYDFEEPKITTPTADLFSTVNTAITANVESYIATQGQYWDNNAFRDPAFPTRIRVQSPGLYLVTADLILNVASGTNFTFTRIWVNRSIIISDDARPGSATGNQSFNLQAIWYFHAGDYAEVSILKNNAGNQAFLRHFQIVGITPEVLIP